MDRTEACFACTQGLQAAEPRATTAPSPSHLDELGTGRGQQVQRAGKLPEEALPCLSEAGTPDPLQELLQAGAGLDAPGPVEAAQRGACGRDGGRVMRSPRRAPLGETSPAAPRPLDRREAFHYFPSFPPCFQTPGGGGRRTHGPAPLAQPCAPALPRPEIPAALSLGQVTEEIWALVRPGQRSRQFPELDPSSQGPGAEWGQQEPGKAGGPPAHAAGAPARVQRSTTAPPRTRVAPGVYPPSPLSSSWLSSSVPEKKKRYASTCAATSGCTYSRRSRSRVAWYTATTRRSSSGSGGPVLQLSRHSDWNGGHSSRAGRQTYKAWGPEESAASRGPGPTPATPRVSPTGAAGVQEAQESSCGGAEGAGGGGPGKGVRTGRAAVSQSSEMED